MRALDNPIRPYGWGSRTEIAELQGRPAPTETPEAELWIGAHAADPSRIDGIGLDKRIEAAPMELLGAGAVRRFGPRLPYLVKYLAAAEPLSIQVHPDAERAMTSFSNLSARHIYLDPHHKPELLVARTRFEVLCGFNEPAEVAEELARLNVPALADVVGHLTGGNIRAALASVLGWPRQACRALLHDAVAARAAMSPERADLILRLASVHPDDPGVFAAMMLRRYLLEPGQAVYVSPGQVHSYVYGAGVEIMASSDNVVRGGLTPKQVDVNELLTVATVDVAADPRVVPVHESDTTVTWPVPVDDFKLRMVCHRGPAETTIAPDGPRILLCVSGAFEVSDSIGHLPLQPGTAAFGAAGDGEIRLRGDGEVFVASL